MKRTLSGRSTNRKRNRQWGFLALMKQKKKSGRTGRKRINRRRSKGRVSLSASDRKR